MFIVQECPVCNSNALVAALSCKDNSISQETFQLIRCTSCHFLMTSPRPFDKDLGKYYSSENYISHSDTAKGLINKLYHVVRGVTLKKKISLINDYFNKPALLDIGSGAGHFLNACIQNGFDAKGVEPDDLSRARTKKQFGIEVFDEAALDKMTSSSFDVITMWHVLEHVGALDTRIQQIFRLLKPEGIAIIALPNCSSHDAAYYQNYWAGYDVPRHLWHFTPLTLNNLMQKFGFKTFKILPMYYDAYYVSMLSEKYKNSTFAILRGIFRGMISNAKAILSKKNTFSSQIYLLRKT